MQPSDDSALLREFAENNSESAFAALVTQHVNLVYSVAMRGVGNPAAAEEITQAVFIILARKAGQLRNDKALSSWLFQTTRLTANNFLRTELRRQHRETEAHTMQTILNEPEPDIWPRIAPLLDSAVAALNEKDRRAILLRFYEGKNLREIGTVLGASEAAAEKRVSRAVEKLRAYFVKRDVTSTTTAITGAISANSIQAAPIALAKTTTAVALAKSATASLSISTLIKGALKVMAWSKAKTAIVVGVVILAAAGSSTIVIHKLKEKRTPTSADYFKQFNKMPSFALATNALDFLDQLRIDGNLPGFRRDEHGFILLSPDTNTVSYPATLTLQMRKGNVASPFPYYFYYTVTKASETNGWQLRKAWRTDTNGLVLEEFSIP